MNIALISTDKLPVPPIAGGAIQLYIEGILPYLSKQHNITVFSIKYPGLPNNEVKCGVRYIRVPAKSNDEYVNNLKSSLKKKFDIIHVFNRPKWVLELGSALPDSRFSLSLHNEMFAPGKMPASKAVECITKVRFINTVSRFIADGVKKLCPEAESNLNIIYSGTDPQKYKPNWSPEGIANKNGLKKKYQIENYKVILFVGRLSSKKGVHVLLNAVKKVMDRRNDVALVVVGSKWFGSNEKDDYTRTLEALKKKLTGPVVFTGFLAPSEVISHYNIGDIFVCPSQWNEPLARVHYEAMAAGLPIITTNRGGNAEVVSGKGNGIVVDDYSNPDAFANNIFRLLSNPSLIRQMGKTGRRLAEDTYNWERVAKNVLESFNQIKEKTTSVPKQSKEAFICIPKKQPQKAKDTSSPIELTADYYRISETYKNYLNRWSNRNLKTEYRHRKHFKE